MQQQPQESSLPSDRSSPTADPGRAPTAKSEQPRAKKAERAVTDRAEHPATKFLTVTIDADSARVVRVEGQDASGARVQLSADEKTSIVRRVGDVRLEDLVEQAFEAGIACVLGGNGSADAANESTEDVELRHQLLAPLIERSAVGHWLKRGALDRLIVKKLVYYYST